MPLADRGGLALLRQNRGAEEGELVRRRRWRLAPAGGPGASAARRAGAPLADVALPTVGFNAATAATPSAATNNGAITFAACTGGTSTLIGFTLADSATTGAGNSLWYGTLASVVISTTDTGDRR